MVNGKYRREYPGAKSRSPGRAAIGLALVLAVTMVSACGARHSNTVIVAGSTSVQPYAECLAEEFEMMHPDCAIDVQGGGSSAGITAVISGTADIGMSSRVLKESERDLWSAEICRDGLAVIVNPNNGVSNLTLEQLRGIYTGKITRWSEVGGRDARIHVISREEGSGTRSAFEDLVMDGEEINPRSIIQDSNGAVIQLVAGDKDGIGFISMGLCESSVKALRLDGIAATAGNVINGSYSLFREFLFITDGAPNEKAQQFIEFTLSPEGRQILIEEGLIPPESAD